MQQVENKFLYPDWKSQFDSLICGFSLPVLGNQALTRNSVTSGQTTSQNRLKFAKLLGYQQNNLFSLHQIHSDKVIKVDKMMAGLGACELNHAVKGDACYTNLNDILLITTWADCVPVLLFDPVSKYIASAHSGWRGTKKNIVAKTINELMKNGVRVSDLYAAIGPAIRACCYQVGLEFEEIFGTTNLNRFLIKKAEKFYFDLSEAVYFQVINTGVSKNKIEYFGKCTCCSTGIHLFSCRKDGKNFEGQAAFIGNSEYP
jgi:polyphenol oxidase